MTVVELLAERRCGVGAGSVNRSTLSLIGVGSRCVRRRRLLSVVDASSAR